MLTEAQNLIPLILFRPLRLSVPAEKIRSARIILLKATHWPYVAAIYAYESASQRLFENTEDWRYQSRSQLKSHDHPLTGNHRQHKTTRYPGFGNRSEVSLPAKMPTSDQHASISNDRDTIHQLNEIKKMVGQLSIQENLEQRLDKQQTMIENLSKQIEELNQRLANPECER